MSIKAVENIREFGQIQLPAFTLCHAAAIPPRAICAQIASSLVETTVVIAELRSDHIGAEEGAFMRDVLMKGHLLLLIVGEARALPAQLVRAWEAFAEHPKYVHSGSGFIRFEPTSDYQPGGMLGIIVPKNYAGALLRTTRVQIFEDNMRGTAALPDPDVRMLGRLAVALSMKALCFLHHRDNPGAQHHSSVSEIIEGARSVTWTDLQRLLRQQPDKHMLGILTGFAKRGLLASEQLDVAHEAVAFLQGERDKDERIGGGGLEPSIYHVLWNWSAFEQDDFVFRGQRNSRWPQETTLLRAEEDGSPPSVATIMDRLNRTQKFLDELATCEQQLVGHVLQEEERLAIAQHYGMATPLLDYTRSLAIAAFFATGAGDASKVHEGDIGIVYFITPTHAVALPQAADTPSGLDLALTAGMRIGRLAVIEPILPDPQNRISRQKGLFVDGFESRDLQRLASGGAIYFRHQEGEAFEDVARGITSAKLLAPEAELQKMADRIKSGGAKPTFSARLGATRIAAADLFGSLGLLLSANLHKAQLFLDKVASQAEALEPGLWPQLRAIIEAHLKDARAVAKTADLAAPPVLVRKQHRGIHYMLDDVDLSLAELEKVVGLAPDALRRPFALHRPHNVNKRPVDAGSPPAATPQARLAFAVGLFLIGLEYLRTVHGAVAEQYFQDASLALLRKD
jgi:hypothetical protein